MAALRVRLLGELEVRRGDAPLALPASRRTRALLGYLVATGGPASRSALCDLLWEGPDDPRAALRWSLTKLRPVVDEAAAPRLVADRERVAFEPHACEIDTARLQALLAPGVQAVPVETLAQCAQWLQGEFLDGLDLPACYRFHHWCMAERERYGGLRRRVLDALVARLAHDPPHALPHARAMVAADPLDEGAHATLVRLLAAAGRYPDAEQHYAWARDLLRREVSMPAGGPLDEAIRAVRRPLHDVARRAPAPAADTLVAAEPDATGPPTAASGVDTPEMPLPAANAIDTAGVRAGAASAVHLAGMPAPAPSAVHAAGMPAAAASAVHAAGMPAAAASTVDPARMATAVAGPGGAHPTAPGDHPLVGRAAERELIARAVSAPDRRSRLVLFAGEPGIGKTRLLDHWAERAGAAGHGVVRGRCFEAEMARPYGLWLDALRGIDAGAADERTLAQAAPLLAGTTSGGGNREALFAAAAALVRALGRRRPLVLLLDDLQWIDEGSAALLHFLARTLDGDAPLALAGAARAGEVDDNRWAKGLLQSLAREDRLERVPLGPLSPDEARALLGEADSPDGAARLLRESGGNPLYLLELARAVQRRADAGGRNLDALIEERLQNLDDGTRDLLAWAAATGRELRPELLASATGLPVAEVLGVLERCVRRGLFTPSGEGHFDFAHDLVRQAVYRALSQPRRRAIHRQMARALEVASADDPGLHGEIARHASLAGDAPAAVRACLAAGRHCLAVFANVQAAAAAEHGLAYVGELPPGAERARLEVGLLRVRVAAASTGGQRLPALAGRIARAVEAAEAHGLHAEAASAWELLSFWCQQAGDMQRAHASSLAAERMTRKADAATHCRQLANSARCLIEIEADLVRGRALLDQAVALAEELDLPVMELEWARGLVARRDGDSDAARACLERAVGLARAAADHWREFECMLWLATLELESGRHAEVLRLVARVVEAAARMGEPRVPFAQALAALARLRAGDAAEAAPEAALEAALQELRELDDKAHLAYALNEAAGLAMRAGQRAQARGWAQEALACARAVRRATEVAVATARLAAATDDPHRAAELLALAPEAASARAARALSTLAPTAPP